MFLKTLSLLATLGLAQGSPVDNFAGIAAIPASASQVQATSYCCQALKLVLGSKVSFPKSTSYNQSTGSYWSAQTVATIPGCIVSPISTQDVSQTVGLLGWLSKAGSAANVGCKFAVRSGGHTPWLGAASIDNGVIIDLSAIRQVTIAKDKNTTSIGPGARWLDVYLKLDAEGISTSGGRVASVGVGGLVTGGGISFFSARYGFVCDNVVNFEVVLASGDIVSANANSNPTLWAALKGGSNNFGIVTRIDLKTFTQGKLWGGTVVYPITTASQQIKAFVDFAGQTSFDVYGALINTYAFSAAAGGWVIANNYHYTQAVANPEVFHGFTSVTPELYSTMRISNLSDFTLELEGSNSYGRRQLFLTATYANDLTTLTQVFNQAQDSVKPIANVPGLSWSLSFQPLSTQITKFSAATGGNSLGLQSSSTNLALTLLTATWDSQTDDDAVTAAGNDLFAKNNAYARANGKLNDYVYLNYAYKTQKPIQGYGAANWAKLKAASKKYDPDQLFQKWVPGGFKL